MVKHALLREFQGQRPKLSPEVYSRETESWFGPHEFTGIVRKNSAAESV